MRRLLGSPFVTKPLGQKIIERCKIQEQPGGARSFISNEALEPGVQLASKLRPARRSYRLRSGGPDRRTQPDRCGNPLECVRLADRSSIDAFEERTTIASANRRAILIDSARPAREVKARLPEDAFSMLFEDRETYGCDRLLIFLPDAGVTVQSSVTA